MSPIDVLRTALGSLRSNKLRSVLTLLGIIIGITAVVVLMSIGRGIQRGITAQILSQGANLLFVSASFRGERALPLTLQDAYALTDPVLAPSVKASLPYVTHSAEIVAGRRHFSTQLSGVTPQYAQVRNVKLEQGEFISPAHMRINAPVAVIGTRTADILFTTRNPVGQPIRINGRRFTVVGVTEDSSDSYFGGVSGSLFVPITTVLNRLSTAQHGRNRDAIDTIYAQSLSQDTVDDAKTEIGLILRLRHRVTGNDDFRIETQQELIDSLNQVIAALVLFLGTVAGISLLVGGIGVMNIMLVSVTERTREIGIRKAMGAKRRDVLFQFITEATLLTLAGGAIGWLISFALTPLLNIVVRLAVTGPDGAGGPPPPSVGFEPGIAAVALLVSAAIGICSGIYPALRAARMQPIEALRYE